MMSLTATGRPWSAPSGLPDARRASAACACRSAMSRSRWAQASMSGSRLSIRSRQALVRAMELMAPDLRSAARLLVERSRRSLMRYTPLGTLRRRRPFEQTGGELANCPIANRCVEDEQERNEEHAVEKGELLGVDDDVAEARLGAKIFGAEHGAPSGAEAEQDRRAHGREDCGQDHGPVERPARGAERSRVVDIDLRHIAYGIDRAGKDDDGNAIGDEHHFADEISAEPELEQRHHGEQRQRPQELQRPVEQPTRPARP